MFHKYILFSFLSADNLCNQFCFRSGPTKCGVHSGSVGRARLGIEGVLSSRLIASRVTVLCL